MKDELRLFVNGCQRCVHVLFLWQQLGQLMEGSLDRLISLGRIIAALLQGPTVNLASSCACDDRFPGCLNILHESLV